MFTVQGEPSSLKESYKFIRREDIPSSLRKKLAVLLLFFRYHGQVTDYSKRYNVSRSFLYSLKAILEEGLTKLYEEECPKVSTYLLRQKASWKEILHQRLIGKCSLSAISELLELHDPCLPNSTCFISQFLKSLGTKLGKMIDWQGSVHYASDEVFMIAHQPVLVTVDPISSAILRMESAKVLTKDVWVNHWSCLKEAQILPLGLVKDEGVVMNSAVNCEQMAGVSTQTDTFHAVSHRLGIYTSRLSKRVDKAMEYEWQRQEVAQNAITPKVKRKKQAIYKDACQQTLLAIEQYESFQFLYSCLVQQFNIFNSKGVARDRTIAMEEVQCALDSMKTLKIAKLNEEIEAIEKLLPQLFNFLPKAQLIQFQLQAELGTTCTYFWIYAWQNDKKSRKIKNRSIAKSSRQKSNIALTLLTEHYQNTEIDFEQLKAIIFKKLDGIVQSSALVETINSLVRPYMNESRNQLSQEQLNIIRFYLNHRVYKRGKRKGYAPIELLRGEKLDKSWCDLLLVKSLEIAA